MLLANHFFARRAFFDQPDGLPSVVLAVKAEHGRVLLADHLCHHIGEADSAIGNRLGPRVSQTGSVVALKRAAPEYSTARARPPTRSPFSHNRVGLHGSSTFVPGVWYAIKTCTSVTVAAKAMPCGRSCARFLVMTKIWSALAGWQTGLCQHPGRNRRRNLPAGVLTSTSGVVGGAISVLLRMSPTSGA